VYPQAEENESRSEKVREERGRRLEALECWWNGSASERSQLRPIRHHWGTLVVRLTATELHPGGTLPDK
jgi:hypothetical protein